MLIYLKHLKFLQLELNNNFITYSGVVSLSLALSELKNLTCLELKLNRLSGKGIIALSFALK